MDWLAKVDPNYVTVATWAIALLVAIGFGWPALTAKAEKRRRERIEDTRVWDEKIIAKLQPDWAHRYHGAIATITAKFDHIYGPRLLGWQAFDRALQFAFVYAILTLLIGWVLFDAGSLGGAAFLPAGQTFWQRGASLLVAIALGGMIFAVFRFETPIKAGIARWINARLQNRPALLARLRPETWAEIGHFVLLILAGAGAAAGAGAGAVAVAVAVALYLALQRSDSFPYFTIDFNSISEERLALFAVVLLFLVLLPILNAMADYLSVAATRQFLRRIHRRKSAVWGVLIGLALDIFIAMACLALLLVLITQTLNLWAAYAPIPLTFDWRSYRGTLCAGDWQQGTMLWLMLATTLAPTALHLSVGVAAMVTHNAHIDAQIAAIITPAYHKLTASGAEDLGDGALARKLLTAGDIQTLEDLLARKEGWARVISILLFAAFMAALFWGVIALAQQFALPTLCPIP